MKIRYATKEDYPILVDMYYDLIQEAFPYNEKAEDMYFYNTVLKWYEEKNAILITYNEQEVTGFGVAYVDTLGGILKPYVMADIAYVLPQYRQSKSAYLIFNSISEWAIDKGLSITVNANSQSSGIISKRWGFKKTFTQYSNGDYNES